MWVQGTMYLDRVKIERIHLIDKVAVAMWPLAGCLWTPVLLTFTVSTVKKARHMCLCQTHKEDDACSEHGFIQLSRLFSEFWHVC